MFEKKNEKGNKGCESCMHYIICGHKDYMKKAEEKANTIETEKSEFIKITAKCTEFRVIVPMPRGGSSVR
jgi:uncharacterized membrane protein